MDRSAPATHREQAHLLTEIFDTQEGLSVWAGHIFTLEYSERRQNPQQNTRDLYTNKCTRSGRVITFTRVEEEGEIGVELVYREGFYQGREWKERKDIAPALTMGPFVEVQTLRNFGTSLASADGSAVDPFDLVGGNSGGNHYLLVGDVAKAGARRLSIKFSST